MTLFTVVSVCTSFIFFRSSCSLFLYLLANKHKLIFHPLLSNFIEIRHIHNGDKSGHVWFNGIEFYTYIILFFVIIIITNYSTPNENVGLNVREKDLSA